MMTKGWKGEGRRHGEVQKKNRSVVKKLKKEDEIQLTKTINAFSISTGLYDIPLTKGSHYWIDSIGNSTIVLRAHYLRLKHKIKWRDLKGNYNIIRKKRFSINIGDTIDFKRPDGSVSRGKVIYVSPKSVEVRVGYLNDSILVHLNDIMKKISD